MATSAPARASAGPADRPATRLQIEAILQVCVNIFLSKSAKDSTHTDTYRKWVCITCGHIYDEALGDEAEGFPAGTRFEDIPDDWCCPDCGATKEDYVLYED